MPLNKKIAVTAALVFAALLWFPRPTLAARIFLQPERQTLEVGDTFDVTALVDTEGVSINAVNIILKFPADKLQVISPNVGRSIIDIYTTQPKFNNQEGTIQFQGGIPNGINVSRGLVNTITFRVKGAGTAVIMFGDNSSVLANDGLGTDVLTHSDGGVYKLVLPPPAGPAVASPTHPDQSRWYSAADVVLNWGGAGEGFSYVLNNDAVTVPDNISEGVKQSVSYKGESDGTHYFHIKTLQGGVWGGTTHFAVNVDTQPPAVFPVDISPSNRTISKEPTLVFSTTDKMSGVDHYEMKVVSLSLFNDASGADTPIFIEVQSPHILAPLTEGSYDVVIRAYDKANNSLDITQRLSVVPPLLAFIQDAGLRITNSFTLAWPWVWLLAFAVIALLRVIAVRLHRRHEELTSAIQKKALPDDVANRLEQLRVYQKKYGKLVVIMLLCLSVLSGAPANAQSGSRLTPPLITSISSEITNQETFYAGGRTLVPGSEVILYWENLKTGTTESQVVNSDDTGEWFYHHPTALDTGNYLIWTQERIGDTLSPPSAQSQMTVRSVGFQFGPAHLSYEFIYLLIIAILLFAIVILAAFVASRWYSIKRRHQRFLEEVRKAEESIRRGFALVRRDIESEFALIKQTKMSRGLSAEEQARERVIQQDLENVEQHLGEEIWELEKSGE